MDLNAGTLGAFFYRDIKGYDLQTRDALVASQQDLRFTVNALNVNARGFGYGMLDGLGVKKHDKVLVYGSNMFETAMISYSAILAGASLVAVDPSTPPADLPRIAADEEARLIYFSPRYGKEDRVEAFKSVFAPEIAHHQAERLFKADVIRSKRMRKLNYIMAFYNTSTPGIERMRDAAIWGEDGHWEHDDLIIAQRGIEPHHTAITHYAPVPASLSSATAGAPAATRRVATATHAQTLESADGVIRSTGLTSKDVVAITAPLMSHIGFASMVAAHKAHAKVVLPSKLFEVDATLAQMALHKATVLVATPPQVAELAAAVPSSKHKITALRTGLVADAAGPSTLGNAVLKSVATARFPGAAAFA